MPSTSFVLFELGIYAAAAITFYVVWRRSRYDVLLMLSMLGFTLFLEEAEIRSNLAYYYDRFLIMIGTRPGWFPLCIGVAWSLVIYSVMRTTRGLMIPWWWLPAIDALLALALDFVLDPVVASDRVVDTFGEWCAEGTHPRGPAPGIGFWVWCVPERGLEELFGIPLDNFVAWFVVVFVFSMLTRVADRVLTPRTRAFPIQAGMAAAIGVASYFVTFYTLKGYGQLVAHGISQALVLSVLLGVPSAMLVVAGGTRSRYGLDWVALVFPVGALGYCWGAFALAGVAQRADLWFVLFILAVSAVAVFAFVWCMNGRRPGFKVDQVLDRAKASFPPVTQPVRLERIEAIDRVQDGALRNLWITQTYHDLSRELAGLTGTGNVNWSSFAIWASGTAGESIRSEEVPQVLLAALHLEKGVKRVEQLLSGEPPASASGAEGPDLFELVREAISTVSAQVAEGNRKVFAELAPLFAAFVASFAGARSFDPARYAQFAARLKPGPVEAGGQDLLRSAFEAYYRAMVEPDGSQKAQWMLLANAQIGLHEQTRLQPNIKAAMDAPLSVLFRQQRGAGAGAAARGEGRGSNEEQPSRGSPLEAWLDEVWQRFATETMMRLTLPGGVSIALDEDVHTSLGRRYPPALRRLDNPELVAFAARFARGGGRPAAPEDWSDLQQRMGFILELFRTTQQEAALLGQPFRERQRARLMRTLELPASQG